MDTMKEACKNCQVQFVEAAYGELSKAAEAAFQKQLTAHPDCRAAYQAFTETLKTMSQREKQAPPDQFFEQFWDNLEGELKKTEQATIHPASPEQPAAIAWFQRPLYRYAAAVLLLVAGIFIGKFLLSENPANSVYVENVTSDSDLLLQTALNSRTRQYFDKSRVLLLGIIHLDENSLSDEAVDFQQYRKISRGLINEAAYLKTALGSSKQQRLRQLVGELEVILLQIAHIQGLENPKEIGEDIEIVRKGVDRRGILLKIDLEAMRDNNLPTPRPSGDQQSGPTI